MAADVFYHTHLRPSVSGQGNETYISFVNAARHPVDPKAETVSMKLTCMNRRLASQLKIGDIRIPTDSTPEFARFENITPVRTEIPAPFGQHLYWRLLSHMSLNYLSLIDVDAIKNLLSLYNYRALFDQQVARAHELMLEGLQSISRRRKNRLFRGVPVRGTRIEMAFLEDRFACDGELFLFSSVLNHFFSLYVSVNSFTELVVKGVQKGETYQWTPHLGKQPMI